MMRIGELFIKAHEFVIASGYEYEIEYVRGIESLEKQTSTNFFIEYVWVVINSGMREQQARGIFHRFMQKLDTSVIRHMGKRAAIEEALKHHEEWFSQLLKEEDKLTYLETLPWIGKITKYHLARNIGIDTVKPDRHLTRLAKKYGYDSPLEMCIDIQKMISEKLGVIDVILWRYCNLKRGVNWRNYSATIYPV